MGNPAKITDTEMNAFFEDLDKAAQSFFCDKNTYEEAEKKEGYFHAVNLNLNYDCMVKNLEFIYCDDVDEKVSLFDNVLAFLRYIVMVEGLEALFSKHYYDIEWNMFMEYDFNKGDMKYYRDHFIHQIRNAYLGYILIWELGFNEIIFDTLKKYPENAAAKFFWISYRKTTEQEQKIFFDNVLRKTWFIAAMFHDIGYPLSYHQRNCTKMERFMPFSHVLDRQQKTPFYELVTMLSSSYLFNVVDYDELEEQYEKADHGMLSAVCLLLNYYNSGLIHHLSEVDRCSVELAAYSIFVHTRKYQINKKDNDDNYIKHERPVFVQDPFAFLLRMCDDLQEWQRLYFYVNDNTNSLICKKCYRRLQRNDDFTYSCNCESEEQCSIFKRITSFQYKKINYLCVCDTMEISKADGILRFTLKYDYLRLLEVLEINNSFAEFRNKELNGLKEFLRNQAMFPKTELDYFLSNNPQIIKIKIIVQYLESRKIKWAGIKRALQNDLKNEKKNIEKIAWNDVSDLVETEISIISTTLGKSTPQDFLDQHKDDYILKDSEEIAPDLEHLYFYTLISKFSK